MFQILSKGMSSCFIETWNRPAKFNKKIPIRYEDIKKNADRISTKWNAQGVTFLRRDIFCAIKKSRKKFKYFENEELLRWNEKYFSSFLPGRHKCRFDVDAISYDVVCLQIEANKTSFFERWESDFKQW